MLSMSKLKALEMELTRITYEINLTTQLIKRGISILGMPHVPQKEVENGAEIILQVNRVVIKMFQAHSQVILSLEEDNLLPEACQAFRKAMSNYAEVLHIDEKDLWGE